MIKNFKTFYLPEAKLGKVKSKKLGVTFDLDRTNHDYLMYVHDIDSEENPEEAEENTLSKSQLTDLIKEFEGLPNPLKIYRVVSLLGEKLNKKHLGNYWSWEKNSVIKFTRNNLMGQKDNVILTAEIDKKYVDWQVSLDQYFQNDHEDECEINISDEHQDKIKLLSVKKI